MEVDSSPVAKAAQESLAEHVVSLVKTAKTLWEEGTKPSPHELRRVTLNRGKLVKARHQWMEEQKIIPFHFPYCFISQPTTKSSQIAAAIGVAPLATKEGSEQAADPGNRAKASSKVLLRDEKYHRLELLLQKRLPSIANGASPTQGYGCLRSDGKDGVRLDKASHLLTDAAKDDIVSKTQATGTSPTQGYGCLGSDSKDGVRLDKESHLLTTTDAAKDHMVSKIQGRKRMDASLNQKTAQAVPNKEVAEAVRLARESKESLKSTKSRKKSQSIALHLSNILGKESPAHVVIWDSSRGEIKRNNLTASMIPSVDSRHPSDTARVAESDKRASEGNEPVDDWRKGHSSHASTKAAKSGLAHLRREDRYKAVDSRTKLAPKGEQADLLCTKDEVSVASTGNVASLDKRDSSAMKDNCSSIMTVSSEAHRSEDKTLRPPVEIKVSRHKSRRSTSGTSNSSPSCTEQLLKGVHDGVSCMEKERNVVQLSSTWALPW